MGKRATGRATSALISTLRRRCSSCINAAAPFSLDGHHPNSSHVVSYLSVFIGMGTSACYSFARDVEDTDFAADKNNHVLLDYRILLLWHQKILPCRSTGIT